MPKSLFSDAYASLLTVLVRLRLDEGVSQFELARRLGKPKFISNVEQGVGRIDVIEFYAIVKALGADPERTFGGVTRGLHEDIDI